MFNIDQILKALQTDPNTQRTALTGAAGVAAGMLLGGGNPGKLLGNAVNACRTHDRGCSVVRWQCSK